MVTECGFRVALILAILLYPGIGVTASPDAPFAEAAGTRTSPPFLVLTDTKMDSQQERISLVKSAMTAAVSAIPTASSDSRRPVYHFHPPAQWMNDPNGPVYYHGWYHVFYQFNPYGDQWGNMHWGHARSKDLVNWQQLPIALWPSKQRGEDHVYSGSISLNAQGKPVAFYTSIGNRDPEQWAAEPDDDDLLTWHKLAREPLLGLTIHGSAQIVEWRDPYVFVEDHVPYMVIGGGLNGRGVVTLYKATGPDLTGWQYLGVLFQHPDGDVTNVECPNIVKLNGKWLLLTSTHGKVESFVGSLDLTRPAFTTERRGVLAEGSYASQLLTRSDGSCIHLAWVHTDGGHGWNGYMTLPSVLRIAPDGTLLRQPISALSQLRGESVHIADHAFSGIDDLTGRISGNTLELIADIDPGSAAGITVKLGASADGKRAIAIRYDASRRTLSTDGRNPVILPASSSEHDLRLHLFLDRGSLDVYAAGGAVTQSAFYGDSQPTDQGVQIVAEQGTATIKQLDVYQLKPARFDDSLYHLSPK